MLIPKRQPSLRPNTLFSRFCGPRKRFYGLRCYPPQEGAGSSGGAPPLPIGLRRQFHLRNLASSLPIQFFRQTNPITLSMVKSKITGCPTRPDCPVCKMNMSITHRRMGHGKLVHCDYKCLRCADTRNHRNRVKASSVGFLVINETRPGGGRSFVGVLEATHEGIRRRNSCSHRTISCRPRVHAGPIRRCSPTTWRSDNAFPWNLLRPADAVGSGRDKRGDAPRLSPTPRLRRAFFPVARICPEYIVPARTPVFRGCLQ
jgi:hypothetical protein